MNPSEQPSKTMGEGNPSQIEEEIIIEVWQDNFQKAIEIIQDLSEECSYVGLDTEFPGVLIENGITEYQMVKENVDLMNMIQMGLTFAKLDETFPLIQTFQFNFEFSKERDPYNKASIKFLEESGMKLEQHKKKGINFADFAELIMTCGLLFHEEITWVTFHGAYDFCYLVKAITEKQLPETGKNFYYQLCSYVPKFIDLKFIIQGINGYGHLGLEKLASILELKRVGPKHQAGSDSLLTMKTFFKLKKKEKEAFVNKINFVFGLEEVNEERKKQVQQQFQEQQRILQEQEQQRLLQEQHQYNQLYLQDQQQQIYQQQQQIYQQQQYLYQEQCLVPFQFSQPQIQPINNNRGQFQPFQGSQADEQIYRAQNQGNPNYKGNNYDPNFRQGGNPRRKQPYNNK